MGAGAVMLVASSQHGSRIFGGYRFRLREAGRLERGGGDEGVRRREAGRLERGGGDEGVRRREAAWLERGEAAGAWRRAALS